MTCRTDGRTDKTLSFTSGDSVHNDVLYPFFSPGLSKVVGYFDSRRRSAIPALSVIHLRRSAFLYASRRVVFSNAVTNIVIVVVVIAPSSVRTSIVVFQKPKQKTKKKIVKKKHEGNVKK